MESVIGLMVFAFILQIILKNGKKIGKKIMQEAEKGNIPEELKSFAQDAFQKFPSIFQDEEAPAAGRSAPRHSEANSSSANRSSMGNGKTGPGRHHGHRPLAAPTLERAPLVSSLQMERYSSGEGESMEGQQGGSTEGMDFCDPSLSHDRIVPQEDDGVYGAEPMAVHAGAFSFTTDAVMQGVVMSEILQRPAQRKWGRR